MAEGDLTAALQEIMQASIRSAALTDLEIGTVTGVDPLEVTVQDVRDPIPAVALRLTEPVVEKKIPVLEHLHTINVLGHSHPYSGGSTGSALTGAYDTLTELREADIVCLEHGKPLPVRGGYIILNRGLEAGDKVLMLKVLGGQNHIILSRVFEGG